MTETFATLDGFAALMRDVPSPDAVAIAAASARNAQLTKPPGALGRLEALAIWMAGWQGTATPTVARPQAIVFAGNHGVAARGVSAFPAEVTAQMVANFKAGGAAINQLSRTFGAGLDVMALDLDQPTADFTQGPAMTGPEVVAALLAGWQAVDESTDILVLGEMGIGNTTVAAALAAALLGGAAADWTGRGTGVDDRGLQLKTKVVAEGLARHSAVQGDPLQVLRCLGGREIAAMVGAMARARVMGVPVILDGFIAGAAAAVLHKMGAGLLDHAVAGHLSAEGAHGRLLAALGKEPILDLGLRLGEGSGAMLALGVIRAALECHSGMATFGEAGVAQA
jgi:nicotinate-nucleotide--dimethylbenzimidazole phosphoribosyltransferase